MKVKPNSKAQYIAEIDLLKVTPNSEAPCITELELVKVKPNSKAQYSRDKSGEGGS